MKHQLPDLPYANHALEPHISAETLSFHHGKHHRAYVAKLNELITARFPFEDINQAMATARRGAGLKTVILFDAAAD